MIKELELEKYEEDIGEGATLLFFYSKTCGPCKMLTFIIEGIDKTLGDALSVIRIDFEEYEELVQKYGIEGYPTIVILKDGEEVSRITGLQQKPIIEKLIQKAM